MKFEDAKPKMLVKTVRSIESQAGPVYGVAYIREVQEDHVRGFWITPALGGVSWRYYADWENWEPVALEPEVMQ